MEVKPEGVNVVYTKTVLVKGIALFPTQRLCHKKCLTIRKGEPS